jgi:CRP-like cAMP-binding protein
MIATPELLRAFPILKPLPLAVLENLAKKSILKKFSRRGIVLNAGEQADAVCFLFEGRLQGVDFTIDGREVGLYFVEPGDFCGELAPFDDEPQIEFVIALTTTVVVFVPSNELRKIMLRTPKVMNVLGSKLASRVRQMTFQRSLLSLPSISQRVCCQLWLLIPDKARQQLGSDEHKATGNDRRNSTTNDRVKTTVIANPPTHMEIAIMLNVSRETVTRIFQSLQNRQIVRRDGSARLIVINPARLQELAGGSDEL